MKTIMIVDDEINILDQVKSCLEEDDYKVITVNNNRKALELMEGVNEKDLGLILIDTSMPNSKKPALFSLKPESRKSVDTSKEEDFLQKPFTKEELVNFIKKKL